MKRTPGRSGGRFGGPHHRRTRAGELARKYRGEHADGKQEHPCRDRNEPDYLAEPVALVDSRETKEHYHRRHRVADVPAGQLRGE